MVPDYQSLMLPLLKLLGDGQEHVVKDIIDKMAKQLNLTDEDKNELLPSGSQKKFNNRVAWAKSYMKQSGLIDNISRGRFKITERGRSVLGQNPTYINVKYLERFPEFIEFRNTKNSTETSNTTIIQIPVSTEIVDTPEEVLCKCQPKS